MSDETWKKTACVLCSLNCGLRVQTGGPDGRQILKLHGDDEHPVSKGYLCEKAQRLNFYQNGADRLRSPLRRRPDGSYEEIDWDTAIAEIAQKLLSIKAKHGGERILYFGGGAQGNHLGGSYADSTLKALGVRFRSNALAQEKTGEFWVQGKMFGTGSHGDFANCEVAVFVGKNPWQSHGFARTRVLLKELKRDPNRTLIVIDPRRSETAAMADYHLAVKPGSDAWCLAALVGILVQEALLATAFIEAHTAGLSQILPALQAIPVARYAEVCGVPEDLLRTVARRIAAAKSVSVLEDLGLQMNLHSTLGSYLQRLIWVLTGHYGRIGTSNAPVPFLSLAKASKGDAQPQKPGDRSSSGPKKSPVTGSKIIIGLIPCNVIPDEILTDHPDRFLAMIIESGNPVHSLADSQRMRQALRALELSVVIDVAMTETARQADYVLPASSQFEKAEATYFQFEFPENAFHVRAPLFPPLPGTLPEAEIHSRLVEALGVLSQKDYRPLRWALRLGRVPFALALAATALRTPRLLRYAPVVLYRVLGPTLPAGMDAAAVVYGLCHLYVKTSPVAAARAGFSGPAFLAADRLFQALLTQRSGVVFAIGDYADSFRAITTPDQRIQLCLPDLLPELAKLVDTRPPSDPAFPFVLAAGERRSDTSNTAIRDAAWHHKGRFGTLRISPQDAAAIGCTDGELLRVTTRRGSLEVEAEVSAMMQPGHISLPNGQGLDYRGPDGTLVRRGVPPNELTDNQARDFLAGTPWHKFVPARLERLS